MNGGEQELLIYGIVSAILPPTICGIVGFFYKPGPLLVGAALTWVSLVAIWEESMAGIFQISPVKGVVMTGSFFLSSFLAMVTGGIYLLVSSDRRSKSGEKSTS